MISDKSTAGSRIPWNPDSCAAVMNAFGKKLLSDSVFPTGKEIQHLINKTPCLKNRSVAQVRTWMHNKKKIKHSTNTILSPESTSKQKNRIPATIYLIFSQNIANKKIPTISECTAAYEKSPTMEKYGPRDLQNMVKKAIGITESINENCEISF